MCDEALQKARVRWQAESLGAVFAQDGFVDDRGPFILDGMVWADDTVLCSSTIDGLHRMFCILTQEMEYVGLVWKPKSLELLRCGGNWSDTSLLWSGYVIRLVERMTLLGVRFDSRGSDLCAYNFREAAAWSHWFERADILKDRRIPLRMRWARMRETVQRTGLHGAGALACTQHLCDRMDVFERKLLKLMRNQNKRDVESEQEFHSRLNSKVTCLMECFGWLPLSEIYKKLHCGWLGHVARHPQLPYAQVLHWKGAAWRQLRRDGGQRLGFRTAGRPAPYVEDFLVERLGLDYGAHAIDRKNLE